MNQEVGPKGVPARGRRYSPAERQEILQYAAEFGPAATMRKYGCSTWLLYHGRSDANQNTAAPEGPVAGGEATISRRSPEASPEPRSLAMTPPHDVTHSSPESQAEKVDTLSMEERHRLILNTWKQHPLLGPSQIKNQLRRLGYRLSVNTVRNVMEEHGYVTPKTKRVEHTGSYEAVRPRQLYHMDFVHLHVHKQKQVLLLIEDDFSRFLAGWALVETERADAVIAAFEKTVARYGKPEAVMTDRGSAFYSWSGVTRFENLLVEYGVDYLVAREPQTNGKVEALVATVQRELVRKVEFADLNDAVRQLEQWVRYYNFERTHHALGGLLVPADRFLGCVEEMMARIQAGQGGSTLDLFEAERRVWELAKIVVCQGQMEIHLLGRKIFG